MTAYGPMMQVDSIVYENLFPTANKDKNNDNKCPKALKDIK